METIIKVRVTTNPSFEVKVMDGDKVVESPTVEAVEIANVDFKKELHREVLAKVIGAIDVVLEDDELLEESWIEDMDDFEEDYGISIEVIKD